MTLLTELVDFEKSTARQRRLLTNTVPSQSLRLQIAKDPFKNKEDALDRLLVYHNTLVTSDVTADTPQLVSIVDRLARVEAGLRETSHFRDSLMSQALRALKLDIPVAGQPMRM